MNPIGRTLVRALVWGALAAATALAPAAAQVANTKHNLSVSGPGTIKSTTETQICIFCHTPHNARSDTSFLWNRADSTANYTTYQSSTLYATVGQPSGASKLCLSCHDGTIALGDVLSRSTEIPFAGGVRFLPDGPTKLGTDLSDDHPVSFPYAESQSGNPSEFASPSTLTGSVKLDDSGLVQCTSCHDPHSDQYGDFLVDPNVSGSLCLTCHAPQGWTASSHATSSKTWNGSAPDPWPHSSFNTVSENACESCHRPHTAGGNTQILNYATEEDNCLACHNGNVAATDIESQVTKTFAHPVGDYTGVHDPAETGTNMGSAHVECADCHNPHQANDATAQAPQVPGPLAGVSGVTSSGTDTAEAANTYEICYKCHADSPVVGSSITRQIPQTNTRLEFDPTNPSYHPVEQAGKNPDVPSLLPPYTTNSVIYCTDCHANDDSAGPKGPHGSINPYLLVENYETADYTRESAEAYALCYKCHDRNSILGDESFKKHRKHIQGENAPCSACHDPHGISSTQGNSTNNTHLINFDINIVGSHMGQRYFRDLGRFKGSCSLTCHRKKHMNKSY